MERCQVIDGLPGFLVKFEIGVIVDAGFRINGKLGSVLALLAGTIWLRRFRDDEDE